MGLPRPAPSRTPRVLLALLGPWALAAAGCTLAPAKVWNLEQLHAPDGSPKRQGRVKSDFAYLMGEFTRRTNFGGEEFKAEQSAEKTIEDPAGACLENVIELGECRADERVAALQAATFSWLAVECTSLLSRERCVVELGRLAQRLEFSKTPVPVEAGEPATPEAVKAAVDDLAAALREGVAAPDLVGERLEQSTAAARALVLDRAGALRLLRGVNRLLANGEGGKWVAPLRTLRLELARRTTALALRQARQDPHGRVRAAALDANLRAFPAERAELLRWALVEAMEGVEERTLVSLMALQYLAHYGLPPTPAGEDAEHFRKVWSDLLVQVLYLQIDGPHTVAACRAIAKVSGEAVTLRPEVWVARARAAESGAPRSGSGTAH